MQEEDRLKQIERELLEQVNRGEEPRAITTDDDKPKKGDK
jgi:hypothetical protein